MAFPTKLLNRDEEIILDLRPHWWRIAPASAALAVAVLIGIVSLTYGPAAVKILAGLIVLAALGYFVKSYAAWTSENFVVTTERVIYRTGVVAKRGIEIPLDRINTVFFNQTLFERILGAGDLGVESAGETGQQKFQAVRKPNLVQQEIYRAMEGAEGRSFQRHAEAIAAAAAGGQPGADDDIPAQIEKLHALRRQGAITDAEFEAKKRELLDRM